MATTQAFTSLPEKPTKQKEMESRPKTSVRYGFVDLLRGFAMVVMIETHVMNAYLPVEFKRGSEFFFWLSFVNGLVAPTFLFAAGFSLVLQGNTQWENWLRLRPPFWKQMRRIGFICLVAYYTHLQGFSLSRYLKRWNEGLMWLRTLQVDVLQCIVVSLLVVHLLIFVLRKKKLLPWGLALIGLCVAFTTPLMWSRDFTGSVPLSLALFLNPHGVSLFPVFPWICFVLAGSFAACFFLRSVDANAIPRYMRIIACLGIAMIAAGVLLRNVPYTLPGYVNFYTTSPLYSMIRIGCVLLFVVLLYRLEVGGRWIPKPIQLAGQESLLVYGVHLWVIFGLLRGRGLGPILGKQMGYFPCFLLSAAIIVAMLLLARYWHTLKKNYPSYVRRGQAVVVLIMLAIFLLS
jgi:uncharacterized membrane protein